MRRTFARTLLAAAMISIGLDFGHSQAFGPGQDGALAKRAGPVRQLTSVAYGNGTFVAVGYNRIIVTSIDGTNWTEHSGALAISTIGINFNMEVYAGGGQSVTLVFPSDTTGAINLRRNPFQFHAVGFGEGKFIITGDNGEIYVSETGEHWRAANTPNSANLNSVICGEGKFVTVGDNGTILTSTDAIHWIRQNAGTTYRLWSVAYGNKTFVAVGGDRDNSVILTSPNGITWTPNEINYLCPMATVAYGGETFIISAGMGYGLTMVSADAKNWEKVVHRSGIRGFIYGKKGFMAVDEMAASAISVDGRNWRPFFSGVPDVFSHQAGTCGNGMYVVVGAGAINISNDGISWQYVSQPLSKFLIGEIHIGHFISHFIPERIINSTLLMDAPNSLQGFFRADHPYEAEWITVSHRPVPGNINAGETAVLNRPKTENYAVLYSEDGINWIRLRPVNSQTNQPTAVAVNNQVIATTPNSVLGIEVNLNGKTYKLDLKAKNGQLYQLQASEDLEHWITLTTLTANSSTMSLIDPDAAKYPQRFYRLKSTE